jgi:flagellar hook-length control protein FliK
LSGLDDLADQNATRVLSALRTLRSSGTDSSISINLEPAHLGSVRLEMTTHNGDVSVRITAEGRSAADTLTSAAPALRRELEADGVRLADLHVAVGTASSGDAGSRSSNPNANPNNGEGGTAGGDPTTAYGRPPSATVASPVPSTRPLAPSDGRLAVDL